MYAQELVKAAKEFAGLKPDIIIIEEERYYNREAVEKYEAFLAGAKCANKTMIDIVEDYLRNTYISAIGETDYCIDDMIEHFREHFKRRNKI